jgi:hypothetical protein
MSTTKNFWEYYIKKDYISPKKLQKKFLEYYIKIH